MNSKNLTFKGSFAEAAQDDKKRLSLSKSKIFLVCCIVFIVGIAVASFLPAEFIQNDLWWFTGVVGSFVLFILFWFIFNRRDAKFCVSTLVLFFLFLGLWRYAISLPVNSLDKIWNYNGKTVKITGLVLAEPDIRESNMKLEVGTLRLEVGASPQKSPNPAYRTGRPLYAKGAVSGKILVTTDLYPAYNYGDEMEIICDLKKPEPFRGFSYDRYLARYDVYSVCYYPKIELLSSGKGNWLFAKTLIVKNKLREAINYGLTEPEAGLARAIMLGDRRGVSQDWLNKFSRTGTTHIMAISGMNITILSALIMNFLILLGLWRRQAFYISAIVLTLYLLLIGFPPSAARAGVMGLLVMLALHLGRLNKLSNSVFFAGAILLFLNPKLLRDDSGFQLSFLAVLGIGWFYPIIGKWAEKIKNRFLKVVADGLNITIAAQIFTLPIIAFNFSTISIISPLANILILWTMASLMVAVLIAFIPAIMFPKVAFLFFLPANFLIKYTLIVVDILEKAPYAYLKIDYLWPNWIIWIVLYYVLIFYAILKFKKIKIRDYIKI